jgi:hypothetical protein
MPRKTKKTKKTKKTRKTKKRERLTKNRKQKGGSVNQCEPEKNEDCCAYNTSTGSPFFNDYYKNCCQTWKYVHPIRAYRCWKEKKKTLKNFKNVSKNKSQNPFKNVSIKDYEKGFETEMESDSETDDEENE